MLTTSGGVKYGDLGGGSAIKASRFLMSIPRPVILIVCERELQSFEQSWL